MSHQIVDNQQVNEPSPTLSITLIIKTWSSLRARQSYHPVFCLILLFGACSSETITQKVFVDHPLDEVPIGCEARRVDEETWEVICADESLAGEDSPQQMNTRDATVPTDMSAIADMTVAEDMMLTTDMIIPEDMITSQDMAAPEDMTVVTGPVECDPPVTLTAPTSSVLPLQLVSLQGAGGSGLYHFEITDNQSDALINAETGAYLSGIEEGQVDTITLSDTECIGEASVQLRVVNGLIVTPRTPQVERGDRLTIEVSEGSGNYEISVINSESGGQMVDATTYGVGAMLGLDVLEVHDLDTDERVAVALSVQGNADINIDQDLVSFPVGATIALNPEGGSGHYELIASPPLLTDGIQLSAQSSTSQIVEIRDRFTQRVTRIRVQAIESLQADIPPQNDHFVSTMMRAQHDLDGDGIKDLIIGQAQADVEALNGGGVFVFLSSDAPEDELYPLTPSQVFSGKGRRDELGQSFVVEDINLDGHLDLIYGARGADIGQVDTGAIFIHHGDESGRFSEEPSLRISSNQNDDGLGASVAVCDVNGDGWPDLIGGALLYENRRDDPIHWNEGALFVYLGDEGGLPRSPDQVIAGKAYTADGEAFGLVNHQIGRSLTAGDYNGDGLCDVVVSSVSWALQSRGIVYVFSGRSADELSWGGLESTPAVIIESDEPQDANGSLGRRLTTGDLNGDEIPDLVISHHQSDREDINTGAVHVFYGGGVLNWGEEAPMHLSPYAAEWNLFGQRHDQLGMDLAMIDYDGEGPNDLMVMSHYGDAPGGWDQGELRVFIGGISGLSAEPDLTLEGPSSAFQMFESATCLGDISGDGIVDWAAQSNRLGSPHFHFGAQYIILSDPPPSANPEGGEDGQNGTDEDAEAEMDLITARQVVMTPNIDDPEVLEPIETETTYSSFKLSLPTQPSGAQFGYGVSWIGDFNGDGFEDAVVTASHASYSGGEVNVGGIWMYYGQSNGQLSEGVQIERFPGFSSWDHIRGVSSVGDFNGDGFPDFGVTIGNDERPRDWSADYWLGTEDCAEQLYDQGGTYIFLGGIDPNVRPDFVYYGDTSGLIPEKITGGFDLNGDRIGDFAIGMIRRDRPWGNDTGGVDVVFGRPLSGELINWLGPEPQPLQVICNADEQYFGEAATDHFGWSLTGVKDLNADGCDELAMGSRLHDGQGLINQGAVFLVFGHNELGCLNQAEGLIIQSGDAYSQFGSSVAAGDIDGDRLTDLAIGAPYALYDSGRYGGAWLIPGSMIAAAPRVSVDELFGLNGTPHRQDEVRLWFEPSEAQSWFAPGTQDRSEAGWGVGILTRPWPQAGALLLGELRGSHLGISDIAAVQVFEPRRGNTGIQPRPSSIMWGETHRPFSRMGESISTSPYSPRILIGAREGGGVGLDHGSAYVLDLSMLWP